MSGYILLLVVKMSDWTSLEAIMRDLSVAQGSCVPASLETYTSNAPPAYNIDEEGT